MPESVATLPVPPANTTRLLPPPDIGLRAGEENQAVRARYRIRNAGRVVNARRVAGAAGEIDGIAAAAHRGLRARQSHRAVRAGDEIPDVGRARQGRGVTRLAVENDKIAAASHRSLRAVQIDGAVRARDAVEPPAVPERSRHRQSRRTARFARRRLEVDALTRSTTLFEMPVPPAFVACAVSVCTPWAETVTLVLQAPAVLGGSGAEQGGAVVDGDGQARIGGVDGAGERDGGLVALQGRRRDCQC